MKRWRKEGSHEEGGDEWGEKEREKDCNFSFPMNWMNLKSGIFSLQDNPDKTETPSHSSQSLDSHNKSGMLLFILDEILTKKCEFDRQLTRISMELTLTKYSAWGSPLYRFSELWQIPATRPAAPRASGRRRGSTPGLPPSWLAAKSKLST